MPPRLQPQVRPARTLLQLLCPPARCYAVSSLASSTASSSPSDSGLAHLPAKPAPEFTPRLAPPIPSTLPNSYFLGHHRAALTRITQLSSSTSLTFEIRDHRLPLSSTNPLFTSALNGIPRIIVYTKRDLSSQSSQAALKSWHESRGETCIFVDARDKGDVRKVVRAAQECALQEETLTGTRILLIGMPNTGKSTLINTLRGLFSTNAKPCRVGAQPGITRSLSTIIKISKEPLIYVTDTPGVFVPYMPDSERMLKLSAVGCVKDGLVDMVAVADYVLWWVNLRSPAAYRRWSAPTNNIMELLENVGRATGRLQKGGGVDSEATAKWLVERFREGKLGTGPLENVGQEAWEGVMTGGGESDSARRRRIVTERKQTAKQKRDRGSAVLD